MRGLSIHSSCCQIRGMVPAVTPAPLFSLDHSQEVAILPYQSSLAAIVTRSQRWRDALDTRPPKFPPHGIFVLRI
jgi:hypothetical protein